MEYLEPVADDVRELMGVPIEDFTTERDALVRRLRGDGHREAAAELAGLRRPSPALWAANQVQRRDPELLRRLLSAGESLREAQGLMLAGQSGVELTEPAEAHLKAVMDSVDLGREALREVGRPATAAMLDRLRETLVAASLAETTRVPLAEGRLVAEVPAASIGFGVARPSKPAADSEPASAPAAAVRAADRARLMSDAHAAMTEAEGRRDAAIERLHEIQSRREELERADAEAQRALSDARRTRADADAALRRAASEEESARYQAENAEQRAEQARVEVEATQGAIEEARAEIEQIRRQLRGVERDPEA